MIGEYIIRRDKSPRITFEMGVCETCGCGGKLVDTTIKDSKRIATFKVRGPLPTLFEKEDIRGRRYDRLCGNCITRIEMLEVKRAGIEKVTGQ